MASKDDVRAFWDRAACGEELYMADMTAESFRRQAAIRYELEPYILPFARFADAAGKNVLEIGVGLGADHQRFAEAGAKVTGIDLTARAVEVTRRRFRAFGLDSSLQLGDAENLPFPDCSFDLVYSWGVIHHSPNTRRAVAEIFRVLRPGGLCRVMIYHRYSLVGYMLWLRYGLLAGRPFTTLNEIYAKYLESPGTKAYSEREARAMFVEFDGVTVTVQLTHGDLLASQAGQRHGGILLSAAKLLWPRWLLRRVCARLGLFMLIEARRPL